MDPVGRQKKIKGDEFHVSWQKLLDGGGAKKSYDGISLSGGTRKADGDGRVEGKFQGKVEGDHRHNTMGD